MKQTENRQPDSVAKEREFGGERSVFKLFSGKEPLRPIQRIGIVLLNGIPLLAVTFFFGPLLISMLKDAPIAALFLLVPIILLWTLITLAMGRLVWVALTAPSQTDE